MLASLYLSKRVQVRLDSKATVGECAGTAQYLGLPKALALWRYSVSLVTPDCCCSDCVVDAGGGRGD